MVRESGILKKMDTLPGEVVLYQLNLAGKKVELNSLVGKKIRLTHAGKIICSHCQKVIKKSYSEGFCYPCSMKLAACDLCILRPQTCHYHLGTCREPKWGEEHCFIPHYVYLANSSGLKVGITRHTNAPYRWMDQGASAALVVMEVKSRLISGEIEVLFKKHISDKTDWRKMLKGETPLVDLGERREHLLDLLKEDLKSFDYKLVSEPVLAFNYPVLRYPEKVQALGFEKHPVIEGELWGIKGQYLILSSGVLNIRSHTGYEVTIEEIL